MTNEYKTTPMTNVDTYKGCEDRTGVITISIFAILFVMLMLLASINSNV